MALDRIQLSELARANAKASLNPSATFSFGDQKLEASAITSTFARELNELSRTPADFRNNANLIYELIEIGLSEVLPVKVLQTYGQFADVQQVANGDKVTFKVNISEASKKRAKQFVTKVGAAGRYETFKLDGYTFTVPTSIYGGAARIEWEELLAGKITLNDYYQLVLEGLNEAIYKEIADALSVMITELGTQNKYSSTSFQESQFDKLIQTADIYGHSTIYCTYEFAATMLPNSQWASDNMKDQIWNNGAFTSYKGHQVVILPQSFEDTTNTVKVIDPSYAYIIPTGADKPVKVAFEGTAQVKQFEHRDWSTEIQTYQKIGVASYLVNPGICVYQNTSLTKNN